MNNTVKSRIVWYSTLIIVFFSVFLFYLNSNGWAISASENGPLENSQALLIALSCTIPLLYFLRATRRAERLLLFVTALLPFSFFFREVEIKNLELPSVL
ncbi:MAG: hypothetical protein ACI9GW_003522, partial [Halieaceae bacterium]